MKEFKNKENTLFGFDDDCFDVDGKCINEYALKVIKENNLVKITKEEAETIRNYNNQKQIEEVEKQLIIQKEIDEAKKITDFYEIALSLGVI